MMATDKQALGQYYTKGNPFVFPQFRQWLPKNIKYAIDPFAGYGDIPRLLGTAGYGIKFDLYDIAPAQSYITQNDSICNFPARDDLCVTNPPYLAKNSAKRKNVELNFTYIDREAQDLYEKCLRLCLVNCRYVAAILPASFISHDRLKRRLSSITELAMTMFDDTECPVCLALFDETETRDWNVYRNGILLGKASELRKGEPDGNMIYDARFNDPDGKLGLKCVDNTSADSIRFCDASELDGYPVSGASRHITRISTNSPLGVDELNARLAKYRELTKDAFLTAFKGLRKDGRFRRRLDYATAKKLITAERY